MDAAKKGHEETSRKRGKVRLGRNAMRLEATREKDSKKGRGENLLGGVTK